MKSVAIALLLCVVSASAAVCSVEVVQVLPSSQNPIITVLSDGIPQQGAKLTVVVQNGRHKQLTVNTDSHGVATLPRVPPGTYCVVASTSPTLRANLCLRIAPGKERSPSAFTMQLAVMPPPPPTPEERIAAAANGPVNTRSREFAGVVVDPSGAVIPRVSIVVRPQLNGGATHRRELVSDQNGRFAAALRPGRYTAIFTISGFATQVQSFEIVPDTDTQELRVTMQLGAVS